MTDAEMDAREWVRLAQLDRRIIEQFDDWELTYTRPGTENHIDNGRLLAESKQYSVQRTYGVSGTGSRIFFKSHQVPREADQDTWVRPVLPGGAPIKLWRKRIEG